MAADQATMLDRHVQDIAKRWPAVAFHPDDPQRQAIEQAAEVAGIVCVPDAGVMFRSVTGCPLPPRPVSELAEGVAGEDAARALGAALLANPFHVAYAGMLLAYLADEGWTLTRAGDDPTPTTGGTPTWLGERPDGCVCYVREDAEYGEIWTRPEGGCPIHVPSRCASCDHLRSDHAKDDGRCWYTVTRGIGNLVCSCDGARS